MAPGIPRVMHRSYRFRSYQVSNRVPSRIAANAGSLSRTRSVMAGYRPSGGSTMSDVRLLRRPRSNQKLL